MNFEIKNGRVWFGNQKFFKQANEKHNKEDSLKEYFFDKAWNDSGINKIESASLLLKKYIPILDVEIIKNNKNNNKAKSSIWFSIDRESIGGESKALFLNKFIKWFKEKETIYETYKSVETRLSAQAKALENQGYKNIFRPDNCLKLKTVSRLVVGLSDSNVLEVSLILHHIFGIPYIPASTLKGVVRMVSFWDIITKLNRQNDKGIKKLQEQLYNDNISDSDDFNILKHKLLFGTKGLKGLLVFLDSFPVIPKNLDMFELDVMTPHYSNYYTQGDIPGDWENPKPIVFLTIREGVEFCFYVLFDQYRLEQIKNSENISKGLRMKISKLFEGNAFDDIRKWFSIALEEFGLGAKSRLGYGIFTTPTQG
ncbi:type III-B CRISPR module RAMP protein Cmr6 [Hydrogenobaculum acidophilum]